MMAFFVRKEGLEPPRLSAPDPKSGAATNYATCAPLLRTANIQHNLFNCKVFCENFVLDPIFIFTINNSKVLH